jgi:DNA-binding MarR family transcriptional regulator
MTRPVAVTHGHEVHRTADPHERYAHQILSEIEDRQQVSQRSLAQSLGIALGLTNLLIRRLVRKGWIRIIRIQPNRVKYFLTPAGMAEKTRMSRDVLQDSVRFYLAARDRIRASLTAVGEEPKRVVFYGTGEVAEIAYVCLQETPLELVGVVTENGRRRFFGCPVFSTEQLQTGEIEGTLFDCLIVTSFDDQTAVRERLAALTISPDRIHWL